MKSRGRRSRLFVVPSARTTTRQNLSSRTYRRTDRVHNSGINDDKSEILIPNWKATSQRFSFQIQRRPDRNSYSAVNGDQGKESYVHFRDQIWNADQSECGSVTLKKNEFTATTREISRRWAVVVVLTSQRRWSTQEAHTSEVKSKVKKSISTVFNHFRSTLSYGQLVFVQSVDWIGGLNL